MEFDKNSKGKTQALMQQTDSKADVLAGLKLCCNYFESNIVNNVLFAPEFEASKTINLILETKHVLTEADVSAITKVVNELGRIDHYNGSGWLDYKIRLGHFLRLSGFDINSVE